MPSPDRRESIANEAGELFHLRGYTATGVDLIARELHISKRSLYELFAGKDDLIAESLRLRDPQLREALIDAAASGGDPVGEILALFDGLAAQAARPGARGCPFTNAVADLADPGHPAHEHARAHKEAMRAWLHGRVRAAKLTRPDALSRELMLILDGTLAQGMLGLLRPADTRCLVTAALDAHRD